jgi:hypothetical protein
LATGSGRLTSDIVAAVALLVGADAWVIDRVLCADGGTI